MPPAQGLDGFRIQIDSMSLHRWAALHIVALLPLTDRKEALRSISNGVAVCTHNRRFDSIQAVWTGLQVPEADVIEVVAKRPGAALVCPRNRSEERRAGKE